MAKKRKSDASRLDEVERSIYSTFCAAANSLSQIYTQAMAQRKASFQAGERHALEKLYEWMSGKHEETSNVTTADVIAYLQQEMESAGEELSTSPRDQSPAQHPLESMMPNTNSSTQTSSPGFGQETCAERADQTKMVFANALASHFPPYHLPQVGECYPQGTVLHAGNGSRHPHGVLHAGNGSRNTEHNQNKDPSSNDLAMDMQAD